MVAADWFSRLKFMRVVTATLLLVLGLLKLMAAVGLIVSTLLDTGALAPMDKALLESVGLRIIDHAPLLDTLAAKSIVVEPALVYLGLAMLWAITAPLFLAGGFAAMRCKRRGVLITAGLAALLVDGLSYGLGIFGLLNAAALASGLLALNLATHIRPGLGLDSALDTNKNHDTGGLNANGERGEPVPSERQTQQRDWLDRVLLVISILGLFALVGVVAKRWIL